MPRRLSAHALGRGGNEAKRACGQRIPPPPYLGQFMTGVSDSTPQ